MSWFTGNAIGRQPMNQQTGQPYTGSTPAATGFNQTGMYGGNPFPGSMSFDGSAKGGGANLGLGQQLSNSLPDPMQPPSGYQYQAGGSDAIGMGGGWVPNGGGGTGGFTPNMNVLDPRSGPNGLGTTGGDVGMPPGESNSPVDPANARFLQQLMNSQIGGPGYRDFGMNGSQTNMVVPDFVPNTNSLDPRSGPTNGSFTPNMNVLDPRSGPNGFSAQPVPTQGGGTIGDTGAWTPPNSQYRDFGFRPSGGTRAISGAPAGLGQSGMTLGGAGFGSYPQATVQSPAVGAAQTARTGSSFTPAGGGANWYRPSGGKTVKMRAPDGTVETVDPAHVDHYTRLGARVVA